MLVFICIYIYIYILYICITAWPFVDPVNTDDLPDYLDIVKEPVDLSLIRSRLESDYYKDRGIFSIY